jgi:hypothetical protein
LQLEHLLPRLSGCSQLAAQGLVLGLGLGLVVVAQREPLGY